MDASITNNDDFQSHHQRIPGVQLEEDMDGAEPGAMDQPEKDLDGLQTQGMDAGEERRGKTSGA